MKRRDFLRLTAAASAFGFFGIGCGKNKPERPNILLITTDDLGYDFVGAAGCPVPDITPNIDRLARQGAFFHRYYANIAVCQPVRSVMMTGLYPPRNGALGFEPVRRKVTTLVERLKAAGYHCSILAKMEHLEPARQFPWDFLRTGMELGYGRDAEKYGLSTAEAIKKAGQQNQPFFLMANSMDPHRPLAGS
jgi:N-sulfoglucosamine sulfohydrolase